jgi:chromosome segregation ATPase
LEETNELLKAEVQSEREGSQRQRKLTVAFENSVKELEKVNAQIQTEKEALQQHLNELEAKLSERGAGIEASAALEQQMKATFDDLSEKERQLETVKGQLALVRAQLEKLQSAQREHVNNRKRERDEEEQHLARLEQVMADKFSATRALIASAREPLTAEESALLTSSKKKRKIATTKAVEPPTPPAAAAVEVVEAVVP